MFRPLKYGMKINRNGISFNYYNDELLWLWPWKRTNDKKFVSSLFILEYRSLREYWQHIGAWNEACRKEKIVGYSEDELLHFWVKTKFSHNTVIVLRNVNVELKNTIFWKSVDVFARKQLLKDVVLLFFYYKEEARKVFQSIAPEFAEALLFDKGELIALNNENFSEQEQEQDRDSNPGFERV